MTPLEHVACAPAEGAPVLVEVRRPARPAVVIAWEDYADLPHTELVGTTVLLFVRCPCGERVYLNGPLAVVAAVVRRVGRHLQVRPA